MRWRFTWTHEYSALGVLTLSHFMESIVRAFIDSKLTPLAILAALCLGVFAIVATPREEVSCCGK